MRVVDYKTGRYGWKDGEQFRGGRELQLALYNEAAARLYPGAEGRRGPLLPRDRRASASDRRRVPPTRKSAGTLRQVLRALDDTARAGVFAPVADSCEYCDFERSAASAASSRAARKKADPRLAAFLSIREIP